MNGSVVSIISNSEIPGSFGFDLDFMKQEKYFVILSVLIQYTNITRVTRIRREIVRIGAIVPEFSTFSYFLSWT